MTLAQADFQNALDQVNTVLGDMTQEQATLAGVWTGEAASSFGQALTQYLDDLGIVRNQLALMCEKLSSHTGVYSNTHQTSLQTANGFKQGLAGLQGL
jgi:WXG100 family type VII secretion target